MDTRQILEKLRHLASEGYRYLRTEDDGETWIGTSDSGLLLEWLIRSGTFQGRVLTDETGPKA